VILFEKEMRHLVHKMPPLLLLQTLLRLRCPHIN
jgi:hypothetical protein